MPTAPTLNERALRLADHMIATAAALRIQPHTRDSGARVVDCGIEAEGGLLAGLGLARVCLSGLAEVSLNHGEVGGLAGPQVLVASDAPVAACMASQYAGWQITLGKYFAMGSGPMRAASGSEELFNDIGLREEPPVAVGVLETKKPPGDEVIAYIADKTKVPASKITLLAAPASSQAGTVQVVARSLETALHKLHELEFDLHQVVSGMGIAPLPPVAANELQGIGRTNDAILYGGRVTLWVRGDDDKIAELGPRVPSCYSKDYGLPFATIFQRYEGDFYKIDQMLFSPAEVTFCNLTTGKIQRFGQVDAEVLRKSFLES
jgi:methenyltetrahydromethanopterin cyclohydrolase